MMNRDGWNDEFRVNKINKVGTERINWGSLSLSQYEDIQKEKGGTNMEVDATNGEKNSDLQKEMVDAPCETNYVLNI